MEAYFVAQGHPLRVLRLRLPRQLCHRRGLLQPEGRSCSGCGPRAMTWRSFWLPCAGSPAADGESAAPLDMDLNAAAGLPGRRNWLFTLQGIFLGLAAVWDTQHGGTRNGCITISSSSRWGTIFQGAKPALRRERPIDATLAMRTETASEIASATRLGETTRGWRGATILKRSPRRRQRTVDRRFLPRTATALATPMRFGQSRSQRLSAALGASRSPAAVRLWAKYRSASL